MRYFTDLSVSGRVSIHELPSCIGVTEQPGNHVLIGWATEIGLTRDGEVLWSLRVHDADVPGCWVIGDGLFMTAPVEPSPD
jgi:hypothetical protein